MRNKREEGEDKGGEGASQFVTDEAIGNKRRRDSNCLSFSAVVHWVLSSR